MQKFAKQLAEEMGLTQEDAISIIISVKKHFFNKIPALRHVIDDIFEGSDNEILKTHLHKLILELQQQEHAEKFGSWGMPSIEQHGIHTDDGPML